SIINKFKLMYRDFPFIFEDINLFFEALNMGEKYEIKINLLMILLFVFYLTVTLILFNIQTKKQNVKLKIYISAVILFISLFSYENVYINTNIYNKLGRISMINRWSETQNFQIRGFVYPFIYSSKIYTNPIPSGYNENAAKKILNNYIDYDINDDKKVNIIAIMLEAYNDFSKYESIDFNIDIYENYKKIIDESYHGNIVSNVIGGGTIDTERAFLTGYFTHTKYLKNTNSFVWYLKDQGYYTEAMHPIYGWFYNRRNVNEKLGFDNYDYYENKYNKINNNFLKDDEFFDYIIQGYEENSKSEKPYFNFSVTYQNHGPYDENSTGTEYLIRKDNFDENIYNMVNNYFTGIYNTNLALPKLIEYFEKVNEPTVILFFGDHNPYFGVNNSGYKMLGIDLDFSTKNGLLNYYSVPYFIWGNDGAKKTLNKDFKGEGNLISPNYLMVELFEYLNLKGDQYMQFISKFKQSMPIINRNLYQNIDKTTLNEYEKMQYYHINNFIIK
ncbi:MAG: LTA synthase family protein, partial [Bacilli bacterium]|nr:LTA synthase family protein [Bacilli bacterium]